MSNEVSFHPSSAQLQQFTDGRLSDSEAELIEQHLLQCNACCETLGSLGEPDPLLSKLKAAIPPGGRLSVEIAPKMSMDAIEFQRRATFENADPFHGIPGGLRNHPRYRLIKRLGEGGMGAVFKAEHQLLDRPVVLKMIRPELIHSPESAERFQREARLAAKLAHPHVVAVYEAERVENLFILVMEYVDGQTFSQLLRNRGPLPVAVGSELVRQAAMGLQHLHEQGLVHRDVKPSNLMLANNGRVKVVDLGLALRRDETSPDDRNLTMPQQSMGTIDYMAPEQWQDSHEVDIRADIYSLGCVFYALLTGAPPFGTDKDVNLARQIWAHTLAPIPPIREKRFDVPQKLADVLNRMLAKSQADRFAVPAAVAEALLPFAGGFDLTSYLNGTILPTNIGIGERTKEIGPPSPKPDQQMTRRMWLAGAAALTVAGGGGWWYWRNRSQQQYAVTPSLPQSVSPIKVGILHSLTGTMAISEKSVVDATQYAIDKINARGGVLGRQIESIIVDGRSDPIVFAAAAERLITQDRVSTVFGCWTSASRKTVRPVFEKHNHLLVYPVQYEGLEKSPNIIYTGAAPNQQILPAVRWCCNFLKKTRIFLVGSDYIFPRCANAIIRDQAAALGGEIVGEEYLLLGSDEVAPLVEKIRVARPEAIINTINGDSNVAFFRALRAAGVASDQIPTISFSIAEEELSNLSEAAVLGDYAVWNYFMSINRPENQQFVHGFQARFGSHRLLTDPMEAAYFGVHLWAQAVKSAGSDDVRAIHSCMLNQSMNAPEGIVQIDAETQHTSKTIRIGKIVEGGQFSIIYTSEEPIIPVPYPITRTPQQWNQFVTDLQLGWGGVWYGNGTR